MTRFCLLLVLLITGGQAVADLREPFPRPAELEADIDFWKRVYTEVDTNGGLLHDNRHLEVVYEVIRFPEGASRAERRRILEARREQHRDRLLAMAQDPDADSESARSLRAKWGEDFGAADYRAAADRIRFQLGQSDRFRAGLERSGRWDDFIREVMREHQVPEGMVALPHVESSFTPYARSRVGASGMWQFTRGTGERFMQVDHVVDERLDPWHASVAAAQLLRHNYETTGSWALALTAYNHGAAGVRRAVSVMGTDDIVVLNRQYEGRRFGFASRNFYPSFLAALDLHAEPDQYFDDLDFAPAQRPNTVTLGAYVPVRVIAQELGLAQETLRQLNPALLSPIWEGRKYVPRGYPLRLPQDHAGIEADQLLAAIPASYRHARQQPDRYHVLRRGETLSHVANQYGVSLQALISANGLRNPHRVRAGQRLTLPGHVSTGSSIQTEQIPEDGQYQVRRGDNLSRIATRFGTSVDRLKALNDFDNGDRIFPGQQIRVAAESAVSAAETGEETVAAGAEAEEAVEAAAQEADPAASEEVGVGPEAAERPAEVGESDIVSELAAVSLAEAQPELAADPADYAVGPDGRIRLQWGETLGHHADWLDIPTQRLRQLNALRFGQSVSAGQRLRLDFSRVQPGEYEARRLAFHQQIQSAFFSDHQIEGVRDYTVRSGDSLWVITRRFDDLPEWLIQQYNPDVDMTRIRPGDTLRLPEVTRRH